MGIPRFFKRALFWRRFIFTVLVIPTLLFSIAVGIIYAKQETIVQHLLETLNKDFRGELEISGSHIEPFLNFPYISIDLEDVKVYETKADHSQVIAAISDVFLGFNLWNIIGGNIKINDIKLRNGDIHLIQHLDGLFNIEVALTSEVDTAVEEGEEEFRLNLSQIKCENIAVHKRNEANDLVVDVLIDHAKAKFTTEPEHTYVFFDSQFQLSLIKNDDTTFIKRKHFEVHTKFDYLTLEEVLKIQPTTIQLEHSEFALEGSINFKDDLFLDLLLSGNKDNFDLAIAMAPAELIPVLKRYQNKGTIFFEARVKGKSIHGHQPAINAKFGCENGFLKNRIKNKVVDELNFVGSFTNGAKRNPSTMELHIQDFTAHPESGNVTASLSVINFNDPEIEFQLNSSLDLEFLAAFFNLTEISDMSGSIDLQMNFHDIVNIDSPQHVIEKLNESYYTKLQVQDLTFKYDTNSLPLHDLDLLIEVNGHQAEIKHCDLKVGKSDLSIQGQISDLPAVLHHTDVEVETKLDLKSNFLDVYELTGADSNAVDEQIKNLSLGLRFKSSAKAITESPNLPVGEFFIEKLNANLQHYPHALHDFYADILIDDDTLTIVDFKGMIDESDFSFSGEVKHYELWLKEVKNGDTEVDFDFVSSKLRLEDLLVYQGENYVPKEYRHEELEDFKFHGNCQIHFKDTLHSIDLQLDRFQAKMKLHPLKFEKFNGRIHYEDEHLIVEDFSGQLGRSDFKTTLHYYLGQDDAIKKRDNHFALVSKYLDVDKLIDYNPRPIEQPVNHDSAFNIYTLPFTDMTFDIDINQLNYHQHLINDIHARLRINPTHYLYIDTLRLNTAGGSIAMNGYFNGSDPDMIYFNPDMYVNKVDLDQLLLKFDNFGQDHLVSENLHGEFTGHITGKIRMHADLVPKIDDSEIHIDAHVENGRLENFKMLESFSDYFKNKNFRKVIFDTLENHVDIVNGVMTIPNMTVNTSLGFMEISGTQDADFNYEYYMRIPWKLVTQSVASKLFGKKKQEVDPERVDEIQYGTEKTKYVNVIIKGNLEDYTIKLGKKKKKP
ncbi:MAG: AsmA-like C-terminal region-containing protein [Flammeovirgaceae bacterium]